MQAVVEFLEQSVFNQLAGAVLAAAVAGALGVLSRQPLVVAFIVVGIVAGPSVLGTVADKDKLDALATMGIALLLFAVGLKPDVRQVRTIGPVALATGLGQVFFTSVIGFLTALGLGLAPTGAVCVAVALTTHEDREAAWLEERGADLVLLPYRDAGAEAADRLAALAA
jgi:Kef-type K+ transport system membrane component KefB